MKVTSVVVQPPSVVAQIEGKANKALTEKCKEMLQKQQEEAKQTDEQKAESAIDLLV